MATGIKINTKYEMKSAIARELVRYTYQQLDHMTIMLEYHLFDN